ncbi:MAG: metal ABC transporter ATP-binding protein [Janthinobacterium lividum]
MGLPFNYNSLAWCLVGLLMIKNKPFSGSQNIVVPLLSFHNLSVKYRDQIALKNITGQIDAGSLIAILGPNGGGKSTFLKTLIGFHQPFKGTLKQPHLHQSQMAYLPQHTDIDRSFPLTVREVVAMGLTQEHGFFNNLEHIYDQKIKEALAQVGLSKHIDRALNTLSGGQFQRTLFARLSLQCSDLILLDEPFTAMDHTTIEDLMKLILNWHNQGKTILVVTHDFELVQTYFSQTMLLAKEIIAWGDTKDVLTLDNLRKAKTLSCHWENQLDLDTTEILGSL